MEKHNLKSNIKSEPKLISLDPIFDKDGNEIKQIQPFLKEWDEKYDGIPIEDIPQVDIDKYNKFFTEFMTEGSKLAANNFIKHIAKSNHENTDWILDSIDESQKKAVRFFIIQIEKIVSNTKASNILINLFHHNLSLLALTKDSPKFSTEIFIERLEGLKNNIIKYIFYLSARVYLEAELKINKDENYRLISDILQSKAYQIKNLIYEKPMDKKPKQSLKKSYIWLGKPDIDLPELYDRMTIQYKLISPETTLEQFKAVFTGQPIDDKFEPIRWHQDNASELLYFIDRLEQAELIEHNEKKADYQKMTACFVKPDGKQFNANWKQIKQNIIINVASAKQKAIDELVKNFL